MKFNIASISALAALTSANFLEQNEVCGDNKDCERDSQDGRYHIVADVFHLVNFGCSLAPSPGPVTYANPDCHFGLGDGAEETAKAHAACDSVDGTFCRNTFVLEPMFVNYCVMLNKDVAAFKESCNATGGAVKEHNKDFGSYEILVNNCK